MSTHNYLFDVKIFSSVRVEANSEAEARSKLSKLLDCCDVSFGNIDDQPIIGEASIDGEADLVEVDGEWI